MCDFRSQDVALKGQGAPLVPLADSHLFSNYEYTLNLGGFANLATNAASNISGFDICVCNLALNNIALQLGHPFDDGGELAKSGQLNKPLLDSLNNLDYYLDLPPKSLGTEWIAEHITTLLMGNLSAPIDLLHTLSEHIAIQIGTALPSAGRCLVTGGGAYNTYLIERIRHFAGCDIIIPDKNVIDYKEAIDFAFLGALRLLGQTNVLSSVTGAKNDTISGAVYIAQS